MQQLQCQSCGDTLQIENQFVRAVTCRSCGASYVVSGSGGLDPTGQSATLADYPSRLHVGALGTIQNRRFTVLGRIRYGYDAGFWEEWQIQWDDGAPPDWLEEDEGVWTLYQRARVRGQIPPYDQVSVGSVVQVNNVPLFITEKRTAQVIGSEGQFASVFPIKGTFGYITGAANGEILSVNYWTDEIEVSKGTELEFGELQVES